MSSLSPVPSPSRKQPEAWPYPHCPNFLASLSRPPSSRWVVAGRLNRLLTCIAPARLEKPLPLPVPRTALSAHQSENSECGHPNNFRFLWGAELTGSEVSSGASSLARAGAGGLCDGLGAPGARGEGPADAGPRPEGRRVAACTLRSLDRPLLFCLLRCHPYVAHPQT